MVDSEGNTLFRAVHPHGSHKGHIPHLPGPGQAGASRQQEALDQHDDQPPHRCRLRFSPAGVTLRHFIRDRGSRIRPGSPFVFPSPAVKGAR